jgi:pyruvate-formate lyase-activating enzyme
LAELLLSENGGGVIFSGGEPLFQSDFFIETIAQLNGPHILLDTSGYVSAERFKRLAECVDVL